VKISSLRTLFHLHLSSLYEKREVDAIFFTYIEAKYNLKKYQFLLHTNDEIEFEQTDIEALAQGLPIQYLIKKTKFFDLSLCINSSVLIPRPETEELVALVLNEQGKVSKKKVLDIGTGSGAIAIALAKNMKNAEVWVTDISENALETAQHNAILNHVKINFLLHDILSDSISSLPVDVNIMVSNPPYIPISEQTALHKNVINYEPHSALFVPDTNPLIFYNAIAETAKKILRKGGTLYFETHEKFHSEISEMLNKLNFKNIMHGNDINGNPRFISCKKL